MLQDIGDVIVVRVYKCVCVTYWELHDTGCQIASSWL